MTGTGGQIDEFVLVAGPNGSGKSTLVDEYVKPRFTSPFYCADNVVKGMGHLESDPPSAVVRQAQTMVDERAEAHVNAGEPCVVETVLSSNKYMDDVQIARAKGLLFRLVYVIIVDPTVNVDRVAMRVAKGGHNVPEQSVLARWDRSLDFLPWFAERADKLVVFDNSDTFQPIALRRYQQPLEFVGCDRQHPAWAKIAHLEGTCAIVETAEASQER